MAGLVCWRCGASLQEVPKPLTRLSQCKDCGVDLHVCLLCKFYNPKMNDRCDHEMAEPAREIGVANFCHYFRPRPDAYNPDQKSKSDEAMDKLKSLFGNSEQEEKKKKKDKPLNKAEDYDEAKSKFDDLFK